MPSTRVPNPDTEHLRWERKVEAALSIYGKVRDKYSSGRITDKAFMRLYYHKQPKNSHYKVMRRIIEFLEDWRGEFSNPWEYLFEDYITCIHQYYARFRRMPFFNQIAPSEINTNLMREFIEQQEFYYDEPYWKQTHLSLGEISKLAKVMLDSSDLARRNIDKVAASEAHQYPEPIEAGSRH